MSDYERKWHFGLLPFTGTGHLNPFLALAQELKQRGHRVTFFEKPKIKDRVCAEGFEFVTIGRSNTVGKLPAVTSTGGDSEFSRLQFNLKRISNDIQLYLRETPDALHKCGIDALIVDEVALTGPTVAQRLGLPYFLISTSVPHRFGWGILQWASGYRYSQSKFSWLQSVCLEVSTLRMRGPLRRTLDSFRRELGLGPVREILREYPPMAHITQLPPCLGRLHRSVPAEYYDVGPFVSSSARSSIPFPWHKLDGRPVIYASLGTTRNVQGFVFSAIAEACSRFNVQLIISLGNRFDPAQFPELPGYPILVKYAPQVELLKIARIVITHGGANTVFESLAAGKPMIVIPLAYDQPAMAARLSRLQVAESLPVMRLSAKRIRDAITKMLRDDSYQLAAIRLQAMIFPLRGSDRAASIIEASLRRRSSTAKTQKPPDIDHSLGTALSGYIQRLETSPSSNRSAVSRPL